MAKTPKKPDGFEEAPQPALKGAPLSDAPLSGDIASWADEVSASVAGQDEVTSRDASPSTGGAADAAAKAKQASVAGQDEATSRGASPSTGGAADAAAKAKQASVAGQAGEASASPSTNEKKRDGADAPSKAKKPSKQTTSSKTVRGTIIGDAASPKERAATGLNPVSGLDISLEDAEKILAKQASMAGQTGKASASPSTGGAADAAAKANQASVAGQDEATSRGVSPSKRSKASGGDSPTDVNTSHPRRGGEATPVSAKKSKSKSKKKDSQKINKPFGYDGDALSGVSATVDALTKLISEGDPLIKHGEEWIPHRPPRPEKSLGGIAFKMETEFTPSGDQPRAIRELVDGINGVSSFSADVSTPASVHAQAPRSKTSSGAATEGSNLYANPSNRSEASASVAGQAGEASASPSTNEKESGGEATPVSEKFSVGADAPSETNPASVAGQDEATSRDASPSTDATAEAAAKTNPASVAGQDEATSRDASPSTDATAEAVAKTNPASVAGQDEATSRDASPSTDATAEAVAETNKEQTQVLLGVTGSGKTFTMAKVIEETQRPAIILAHNKTLAAQLYGEMKNFFPDNAVEYFVSYYDYYQPEAYVPRSDTYIEKESSVNEQIDRMRHSATRALLERDDVIIVSSVSCIYGIGSVETYTAMTFEMKIGDTLDQRALLADLVAQQYKRNDADFTRGSFRVRGDTIEIFPAHLEDSAWRISLWGDEIEAITEFDPLTGKKTGDLQSVKIYANSHYVTPRPTLNQAIKSIKIEMKQRLDELNNMGRLLEAQRLEQRTRFDLEMLEATGSCAGIENYSRYLTGRKPGEPPPTLFEYIPDNALVFVDESHVTIPQIGAMYRGDFRRKATLAEYGFRLPSCMDNRPLRFEEWNRMRPQTVCVSATPSTWEMEETGGVFAEQVIRPTGLIDPPVDIRPATSQVDDVVDEIQKTTKAGYRTLVTVLTKRMAEDLTEYLHEAGIKVRYMHSDIDTLERIEIIRDLRLGTFDCLVGINLLREGLDIPECALVAILDADKEGFLRSETSLVQTIGRAARNVDGKVILYADRVTGSMERAMAETDRRRDKQLAYNEEHGITPESIKSKIGDVLGSVYEQDHYRVDTGFAEEGEMMGANMQTHIEALEKQMLAAAADLDFEEAARLRDEVRRLQEVELAISNDPMARDIGIENTQENRKRKAQGKPLFRKPHLDEMTNKRTEHPVQKTPPAPPAAGQDEATSRDASPRASVNSDNNQEMNNNWSQPRTSYGEEMRNDRGANSAYGTPLGDGTIMPDPPKQNQHKMDVEGSLARDAKQNKRGGKKKKTGRPGM